MDALKSWGRAEDLGNRGVDEDVVRAEDFWIVVVRGALERERRLEQRRLGANRLQIRPAPVACEEFFSLSQYILSQTS